MLEFSDQVSKKTMISMLRPLAAKTACKKRWAMSIERGRSEEPERDPGDQNHCDRNEEWLWWAY